MKIKTILLLSVAGFFMACTDEDPSTPDAEACFEYAPETDIMTGDEITFTNCSENATTYGWDFGDGDISTEENPTHTYEVGGEYTIKMVAANETSADSVSTVISVAEPESNNYLSFNGEKYALDWGIYGSVSEFEVDNSGRYHEILLLSNGVSLDATEEFVGTGNFINITITTDADNINNIVGDFSNYGDYSESALNAADYSWIGVGLETLQNSIWGMPYVDMVSVSAFTISKEGDIYTISISGTGERETSSGSESGNVELFYQGELTLF